MRDAGEWLAYGKKCGQAKKERRLDKTPQFARRTERNEVSRVEYGFPRDFLDRPFVRDYLHGGMFDRIERW